ncbi:MAG: hypothetical protein A3I07_04130 [Candidatus Doudnabacteria bacterium RIFCSPLOWO2_02_FULL_42_9]|uniref:Uncharacterized protein n=1 Tax=Candidatus Doudnabacteria bacterium RIFCSPHIGHO2_01_FULL_41_86 TaxID=1817821 RepID=A0A1F5N8J1_9BACT|nr:MAG: hypothetical protein A2717_00290 [Candidatus Doudnabacteria bacterium RIFCSPHIGHO2_01_FULL_41_86]OGE75184.1 MAG: hypothetical protein A3K07_01760 [Candidatus Doudnabacteria bacterium RIFCSPHIGHO2_01_43_10]OGE86391.1 MAG: hypothetical protein A3E28_00165 [Candidatus Doudnabacteria bacterium RIFCSPHIGHO2_12_FULL_42_22]OGE87390.1 MAG: hypothetical protein A3C49_04150 [Candidatus Doudnabacteria bacterium RIFCSPHIGHO2_02_FULL_42_25]OGE92688.1 MAG: hypothetical protein A2895_03645 [Candidatus
MDIVRKLTLTNGIPQIKASFATMKPKQKFFLQLFLFALLLNLIPHQSHAWTIKAPTSKEPILVFDENDKAYQDIIDSINYVLRGKQNNEEVRKQAVRQGHLRIKVKNYLETKKSPLAEHTDILITMPNWKRIVALANAESSMCRKYPVSLANCWGVGGSNLWDMGNNLGDGIMEMNKFLENYPLRSNVKYAQMTFKQMNGLYKQPAKAHWLYNVQVIYDDLNNIEKSI